MQKCATTVMALILGCAGLAIVLGGSSAAAEGAAEPFTIRSSLDGKTVLPHRIRWVAYPSAGVRFPGVEFLIDGKLVFDNRIPPYAFGSDGRDEATGKVNTGYLVTSWVSPGRHEFTVRARGLGANRKTRRPRRWLPECSRRRLRRRSSQDRGSASSRRLCRPSGTCCTGRSRFRRVRFALPSTRATCG